jgi:polyhydroxybutyrate depolymerase
VIARWRGIDGCAPSPTLTASTSSTLTTWRCQAGSLVASLVVSGAGHTWPGAVVVNPPGTPSAAVDASRLIADFFAARGRG